MLNTSRNYPTTSAYPIACKYIGESIRHHCVCNVLIWHIRHKDLQTINNSGYYVNFTVIDEPILTQCIIMIISGCGSMVLTHREDGRYLNKDGQASEGLPISSGCRYSNHRKDFYSNTEFTVDEGRLYVHIFEKDMRWHHIEGFSFSLISRSGGYCGKSTVGPPVGGNTPTRSIVRSHILRDWRGNIFVPTDVIPSKSFPICTDLSMHKVDTLEIPPLFIQLKKWWQCCFWCPCHFWWRCWCACSAFFLFNVRRLSKIEPSVRLDMLIPRKSETLSSRVRV